MTDHTRTAPVAYNARRTSVPRDVPGALAAFQRAADALTAGPGPLSLLGRHSLDLYLRDVAVTECRQADTLDPELRAAVVMAAVADVAEHDGEDDRLRAAVDAWAHATLERARNLVRADGDDERGYLAQAVGGMALARGWSNVTVDRATAIVEAVLPTGGAVQLQAWRHVAILALDTEHGTSATATVAGQRWASILADVAALDAATTRNGQTP